MSNGNKFFGEKLYCKNEEVNILKILKDKSEKMEKDLSDVKIDIDGLKNEIVGMKNDIGELQKEMGGLKKEIVDMKQDFSLKLNQILSRLPQV